jgi:hypothetical protein
MTKDFDTSDIKDEVLSGLPGCGRAPGREGYPAAASIVEITLSLASRRLFMVVGRYAMASFAGPRQTAAQKSKFQNEV